MLAAAKQVSGLQNLTNLEELPAAGFMVIALPMKIAGGSGRAGAGHRDARGEPNVF